jgi:sterol desaturase/sphingolipid hydroxylase (fatty acid hydroxylase superfamily)
VVDFILVLLFAPLLAWFTWMYTSPMPRYGFWQVIIRLPWCAALIGGLFVQLIFLSHHELPNSRQSYLLALLVIEAIPIMGILFHRAPRWVDGKPVWRTDDAGTKDRDAIEANAKKQRGAGDV